MVKNLKEINIKMPGQILDFVDTKEHLLELFNYITNLQEENRLLKMSMLEKQFPDLNAVKVEIDTYKLRCEKAIEYIYHWSTQRKKFFDIIDRQLNGKPQFYGDVADLLNILEGE